MEPEKLSKNKDIMWKQFLNDNLEGMDISYEELKKLLRPIFHNQTKYVNGKIMKACFTQIGNIIRSHQIIRSEYEKQNSAIS